MAKITAVILPAKILKQGKHKVRIAIAHNSETRYIVTDIILDSDKEFKNGQIVKRSDASSKNTKLRKLILQYQDSIDSINSIECLTCPELINVIKKIGNRKGRTISSVFDEYIQYANLKQGSIRCYKHDFNSISKFTGTEFPVTQINHRTITGLDAWLRKQKLSQDTIRNRMNLLIIIVRYSERCMYAEYKIKPFDGYTLPERTVRDAWLTTEEIEKIRDIPIKQKNISKCRDIFMLSYFLGGINSVDLIKIDFNKNPKTLCYIRTKTERQNKINKFVEFEIPKEAHLLIDKYKGKDGKLDFSSKSRENINVRSFLHRNMPKLAEIVEIKELIYYSARKSFSQHAFLLGINTSVIDYILGHKIGKPGSCLYSYIKVTPTMATEAIRKVLDNLK